MNKAKEKISSASKLIRHKELPSLFTLKKLWKNANTNADVDVVITFHPNTPEHVILWCKLQLELIEGIQISNKLLAIHSNGQKKEVSSFQISFTFEGYLKGLVLMQVPKEVRDDFGGGHKEFNLKEAHEFVGIESLDTFLTSQERQSISMFLISSLRAETEEAIHQVQFRKGEAIFSKGLESNLIHQIYPIHDLSSLQYLKHKWVKVIAFSQPIDKIAEYFGLQIGFYFAWLGTYTYSLIFPAVIGVLFWLFLYGREDFYEEIGFISFAIVNVVWSSLYLTFWKQKSSVFSHDWGVSTEEDDIEMTKDARPLFKGEERINAITRETVLFYPSWKRNLTRYFLSMPVVTLCLFFVGLVLFFILELQQWFDATFSDEGTQGLLLYIPKILLAVIIPLMDTIYYKIAYWLNDQENYKLQEDYDNHMILKLISFQFVNSFLSLFYCAFYLQDMDKLSELLFTLLITRQILGNIRESFIPFVKKQLEILHLFLGDSKNTASSSSKDLEPVPLSQIEVECNAPEYEGTFDDYLEMVIQFGYVTLFSASYPLAGFFALLNNIIEIRSDAFKLCFVCKRPFGRRVKSIGSWSAVMDMMGAIGVIVNCALLTLPGRLISVAPSLSYLAIIFGALIIEHLLFVMKYIINYAIPEVPVEVLTQKFRIDYQRKQIQLKKALSDDLSTQEKSPSVEIGTQTYFRPMLPQEKKVEESSGGVHHHPADPPIPNILISEDEEDSKRKKKRHLSKHNTVGEINFHSSSPTLNKARSKSPEKKPHHHSSHKNLLRQRMSSDTDLWLSANAASNTPLSSLAEAPNEGPSKIIVNKVRMPSLDEEDVKKEAPTRPEEKKTLNQEDVIKRLKSKQALFSKGRSISIASFKFPSSSSSSLSSSKPKKFNFGSVLGNNGSSGGPLSAPILESSSKDDKYLAQNSIRGELDLLNLDKLINVQDLRKKST